ncbi:unnamed protein product, partial [Amoebophrya sp. A25]
TVSKERRNSKDHSMALAAKRCKDLDPDERQVSDHEEAGQGLHYYCSSEETSSAQHQPGTTMSRSYATPSTRTSREQAIGGDQALSFFHDRHEANYRLSLANTASSSSSLMTDSRVGGA